jgi:hypothetical protein
VDVKSFLSAANYQNLSAKKMTAVLPITDIYSHSSLLVAMPRPGGLRIQSTSLNDWSKKFAFILDRSVDHKTVLSVFEFTLGCRLVLKKGLLRKRRP